VIPATRSGKAGGKAGTYVARASRRPEPTYLVRVPIRERGEESFLLPSVGTTMTSSFPPKTFISDLRPGRVATIEVTVVKLEPVREVEQRAGGTKKVRNGVLRDGTGEISLVLWGDEVDLVAEGDRVRIVEGWVKDYKGRPQVSLGRTGRVEKA
jgi:ssDNA-binding replication factor A large subunit